MKNENNILLYLIITRPYTEFYNLSTFRWPSCAMEFHKFNKHQDQATIILQA